jgi:hypothetical protein
LLGWRYFIGWISAIQNKRHVLWALATMGEFNSTVPSACNVITGNQQYKTQIAGNDHNKRK